MTWLDVWWLCGLAVLWLLERRADRLERLPPYEEDRASITHADGYARFAAERRAKATRWPKWWAKRNRISQ